MKLRGRDLTLAGDQVDVYLLPFPSAPGIEGKETGTSGPAGLCNCVGTGWMSGSGADPAVNAPQIPLTLCLEPTPRMQREGFPSMQPAWEEALHGTSQRGENSPRAAAPSCIHRLQPASL